MADSTRIDKYIWAIRLFKTRSEATEACNGNKVQLNGVAAKPSKTVKAGDSISVRKGAVQYSYKVLKIAENRMGAQPALLCSLLCTGKLPVLYVGWK